MLRPLVVAAGLVGVPAATGYWVLSHPSFELRRLSVAGTERVAEGWIREQLRPLTGRPLLLVKLGEVERLLRRHPWIGAVNVRKSLPDQLHIEVQERRPAAILVKGADSLWVDQKGRVIAPVDTETGPAGLLRIEASVGREPDVAAILAVTDEARRQGGAWAQAIERVVVSRAGDFRIHSTALPFPLLVGPRAPEVALERLPDFLDEIVRRYPHAGAVDLRFANRIVIQDAAPQLSREG